MKVEVLIVGGGPAGAAAGIRLQQEGKECLLVDKQKYPRVKLCAGLFTHKSQDCLRALLGNDELYESCMQATLMSQERQFSLYDGMKLMVTTTPSDPITLIDRPEFDSWLVEHFISLGGRFHDGAGLTAIDLEHNVATFTDRNVEFDYLIAADGANSTVERIIAKQHPEQFRRKERSPMAVEVNVEKEDIDLEGVNIFFNIIPDSYAWAFAKGREVCLGMVKLTEQKFDINAAMRGFMTDLKVRNIDKYKVRGAMIPIGKYMDRAAWKNIMFVGDAAGLVEPLTGEGIYHAMQSGVYAAETIVENTVQKGAYDKKVKKLRRLIDKGAYYQKLLERSWTSDYFFKNAGKHPEFVRHFYDTQIERACFDSFLTIMLKYKLGIGVKKNK